MKPIIAPRRPDPGRDREAAGFAGADRQSTDPAGSGWRDHSGDRATTAGSSSSSRSTEAARSSASARVAATHTAIGSPTCRTLSVASTGCADVLNPGSPEFATIGCTPTKSAAVRIRPSVPAGFRIARTRACASGLRTKASSRNSWGSGYATLPSYHRTPVRGQPPDRCAGRCKSP